MPCSIVRDEIDLEGLRRRTQDPQAGAVVVFAVMCAITVMNRMFRFWNTRHMKKWLLSKSQKLLNRHSKMGTP